MAFSSSPPSSRASSPDVYISAEELVDELSFQKTLLFSLDDMTEGRRQAEANIKAEISRLEARLRAVRGNQFTTTSRGGLGVGASAFGGRSQAGLSGNFGFTSSSSTNKSKATDRFSLDPVWGNNMDSSNNSDSIGSGVPVNLLSPSKVNLPTRKRSFGQHLGFDSAGETENKSRRTSPGPLYTATKTYPSSKSGLRDLTDDDLISRELDVFKRRQKQAEEAAAKVKKDQEYARKLQQTYSAGASVASGARLSGSTGPSAYDRMMGRLNQPPQPSSQKIGSDSSHSYTNGIQSSSQIFMPGTATHRSSIKPEPGVSASSYTPGASMPGSFPNNDSDSDIEVISPNDFRKNNRQHSTFNSPATYAGYGGYSPHAFQNPNPSQISYEAKQHAMRPLVDRHNISATSSSVYMNQSRDMTMPQSNWAPTWSTLGGAATNAGLYPTGSQMTGRYSGMGIKSMNDPIAKILNNTATFDYAPMQDRLGRGLAGEIYDYVNDPRKTEDEIKKLLENIRPDTEIPAEDREGTPTGLKYSLYEHQKLALTWLKSMEEGSNKGGILADDMGLGKTISTLALLLSRPSANPARKTTLIVGPVALIRQWEREFQTKIKDSHRPSTFVYHSGKKATWSTLRTYDVVLTTYGTLGAEYKRLTDLEKRKKVHPGMDTSVYQSRLPFLGDNSKWYRVILDEAQCIKNKNTKAALAASHLQAQTRFCLTGTPMMNGVHELYSLVHFLRIKPYNEYSRFTSEFSCLTKGIGPQRRMDNAMTKLQAVLKAILLRRTKQSQIDGKPILILPEKSEEIVHAIFDEDEQAYYTSLEKKTQLQFNKYLKAGTIGKNYSNILVLLLRLRQAACHPHLIMDFEEAPTEATPEEMLSLAKALLPDVIGRIMAATVPFECPVCYDPVPNPSIVVPCGHDTCAQCLVKISSNFDQAIANGEDSNSAKCPTCRGAVDLKKIIDYETFKLAHMPDAQVKKDDITDADAEELESDTDSEAGYDSDEEDVNSNGDIRGFVVNDDYESGEAENDLEDDDTHLSAATITTINEPNGLDELEDDDDDDDDDLGNIRPKQELKMKIETKLEMKVEGMAEVKEEKWDEKNEAADLSTFMAKISDDEDYFPPFPTALAKTVGNSKPKAFTKKQETPRDKVKRQPKPKKSHRTKNARTGNKDKEPEAKHTSLAKLKKEASKSGEGRRRYMRYLKKNWISSSKIDKCMEILRNTAPDVKTIIFSQFTTLLDLAEVPIQREKLGYGRYDGGMSADARNGAVIKFTDDPRCKVFLVSLKAGNAGLNLVAASQVIILDPFWNPFVEMQAVDRAHRIGQQKPVTVHRILVKGTVEDRIIELQNRKRKLVEAALDENASRKVGRLGREELIFLFGNSDGPERATLARRADVEVSNRNGFELDSRPTLAGRPVYPVTSSYADSLSSSISTSP